MLLRYTSVLICLPLIALIIACGGGGGKSAPKRGDLATLAIDGESTVWVTIDEKSQDELSAFSRAKNEQAIEQMIQSGRLLVCAKNTTVSVLEPGILTTKVRVMDGKHEGKTGYLPSEWVHKK